MITRESACRHLSYHAMVEANNAVRHEVQKLVLRSLIVVVAGLHRKNARQSLIGQPVMEPGQFVALVLQVIVNPQQHVQRIHHDLPGADPLHVSAHDRQQALNVEIAGDDFPSGQAGLDDGNLAGLFQCRQVPPHRRCIEADGLGPFFEGDKDPGFTRHRPATKELQARHRFSGARPATNNRGPALRKSALQNLVKTGDSGWRFWNGLTFSAHSLLFL